MTAPTPTPRSTDSIRRDAPHEGRGRGSETTPSGPRLFRVFWPDKDAVIFRADDGRRTPVQPDTLRKVISTLRWEAMAARGNHRTQLATIIAEAEAARSEVAGSINSNTRRA